MKGDEHTKKVRASRSARIENRRFYNKPGFRFSPTDSELLMHYLKRKVTGKIDLEPVIADVDVYKHAPWDLPALSAVKNREQLWYFISPKNRKYPTSEHSVRGTQWGTWTISGKDKLVYYQSRRVGYMKTLVFKTKNNERTNWVMHEYGLEDDQLNESGIAQKSHVLNKLYEKSGIGARIRDDYGAPYWEEEWESDDEYENVFLNDGTKADNNYFGG